MRPVISHPLAPRGILHMDVTAAGRLNKASNRDMWDTRGIWKFSRAAPTLSPWCNARF